MRARLIELPKDDPLKCPISLFRPRGYGRLETAHTRTLAWLLDDEGEHDFKTTLLAALLSRQCGRECSDGLKVERVESEYVIDAKSRLDVLAEGTWEDGNQGSWILVIEAKVDWREGEEQLSKYEEWVRSNAANRKPFLVFLTPDGREPETGSQEWKALSFLELVRVF